MSEKLLLATGNQGKLEELRLALAASGVELIGSAELGLGPGPVESGTTYEENGLLKAASAAHSSGLHTLADDSGLEVDALNAAPGVYSARFGGLLSDGERNAHLLQRLRGVPPEERGARFVCVLVLAAPDGRVQSFRGECQGRILLGPRGEGGHGYDPLFWSPELQKTFAEASQTEKSQVSHRGRAAAELLQWLVSSDSWFGSTTKT